MLTLAGLKILATSFTISSGGSGGVFGPSLFIGAMLDGAVRQFSYEWFPHKFQSPAHRSDTVINALQTMKKKTLSEATFPLRSSPRICPCRIEAVSDKDPCILFPCGRWLLPPARYSVSF